MGRGKKGVKKKKKSTDHSVAAKCVQEWASMPASLDSASASEAPVKEDLPRSLRPAEPPVIFELHSHSTCSDGLLSPSAVVDRAHRNGVLLGLPGIQIRQSWFARFGLLNPVAILAKPNPTTECGFKVKVLALTDHDTMAGIPSALEAARKYGIRVIPGVEISAFFPSRVESGRGEPVHILAYYGSCGPARFGELEECLASIREGRYLRAQTMLQKLRALKMPLKWESVERIAGDGVAPGRPHVARAMVEAGHVENVKQAFSKYLYDGGPAYATGNEILAEKAIQLICRTGGVSALAHPWALKNPVSVVRHLKAAGLHAIEVYRSDGKIAGFSDLADAYQLLKLGGSDFHGRGGPDETDLGRVNIPDLVMHEFLKVAQPIWCDAVKDILCNFADDKLAGLDGFGKYENLKGDMSLRNIVLGNKDEIVALHLSSWLTQEERESVQEEAIRLKLSLTASNEGGKRMFVVSK